VRQEEFEALCKRVMSQFADEIEYGDDDPEWYVIGLIASSIAIGRRVFQDVAVRHAVELGFDLKVRDEQP
jgi:hypothetical protein